MALRPLAACIAVVLIANLAAPVGAVAADLPQEISQLKVAIQARIDAIGPTPATKAEKKEAKKLGKAIPPLDAWVGNNDVADIVTLGKAAKNLYKSKTQDKTIREEVVDVIRCLFDLAKTEQVRAEEVVNKLLVDKYKIKVQTLIDKAEEVAGTGLSLLDTDYVKAHKSALKAWKAYLKAIAKGEKYQAKGLGSVPDGLTHTQTFVYFLLINQSTKWYFVRDVKFTGVWKETASGSEAMTLNGDGLAAHNPDYFKIQTFPGGGIDGLAMIGKMYPGDTMPVQHDLHQYMWEMRAAVLPAGGQYYFDGTIVLVISNKPDPGGNEKIFSYPIADFTSKNY